MKTETDVERDASSGAMHERQHLVDHPRRPLAQRVGAIVWPSFFSAAVATMVLFAFVDPLALAAISFPDLEISREAGYTVAFFGFWLATGSACLFTWILLRPNARYYPANRAIEPGQPPRS